MANIRVNEDIDNIENVQPKNFHKTLKEFPQQKNENKAVLQENNTQVDKVLGKENTAIPVKVPDQKILKNPSNDLKKLKAVLRNTIFEKVSSVVEYDDEIWNYLLLLEKKTNIEPHYMSKQPHINWNMRSVLIDWLVPITQKFQINENALHLSVNYLDRFMSNISVIRREKFQLVGATAMMLAGKMEEFYPPNTKEWSYLTGDAFTVRQILKMEQCILKVLNFEMYAPTTLDFIKQMCSKFKVDNRTMYLAMYLSELVLLEGEDYLQHFPSKLAAASLVLARQTLFKSPLWTKQMEETAGYSLKQLSPVVQKLHRTFKSSPFKEQQAIRKKYVSEKYQQVAFVKPKVLLLEEEEE